MGFTNPVGTVAVCDAEVWVVSWLVGGWHFLCVIIVVAGRFMHLYIVLSGYISILGAQSGQSLCTLSISATYRIFVCGRYRKPRIACV